MRTPVLVLQTVVLGLVAACGGGEDRQFAAGTGGSSGAAGAGGSATGGSGGTSGGTGGVAGTNTGGAAATGGAAGGGGSAGSGGATGGSGGGTSCESANNTCAPNAPAGWTGPVAFRHGAGAPPACPGAYPTKVADGHAGLEPGAASCKCTCDPATGILGCNGAASIYDVPNTAVGCTVIPTNYTKVWGANAGQCVKATANATGNVALVPPTPTNNGTCAPKANNTIPTPTWGQETRLCGGAAPASGSCGAGQTCMPKAFAPYEMCIYRPGDAPCPTNGYTKKLMVYEGFTDGRTCSACTCGSATSSCKGQVNMVSACSGTPILYSSISGCGAPSTDVASTQYGTYTPAPSGTCPPSTSTLSGTVTTSGESTVCCLP